MLHLELLHHFSTFVYKTISGNGKIEHAWQIDVPNQALNYPFLMHSILALSALHLIHVKPPGSRETYRVAAVNQHDLCLSAFRPHLQDITKENCDALFATSFLITFFVLGQPQAPGSPRSSSVIQEVLELSELIKGATEVTQTSRSWILAGIYAPIVSPLPWDDAVLPQAVLNAMEALKRDVIAATVDSENEKTMCTEAVRLLMENFRAVICNPNWKSIVWLWLTLVDRQFLSLLMARKPAALVIIAHYGVVLHFSRNSWWCKDWGSELVRYIYYELEPGWRPYIDWPVQEVGMSLKAPEETGPERFLET
jgi:hypothetical protein